MIALQNARIQAFNTECMYIYVYLRTFEYEKYGRICAKRGDING